MTFVEEYGIDWAKTMAEVCGEPPQERLRALMQKVGCRFHDDDQRLVIGPSVRWACVGGVPIHAVLPDGSEETLRQWGRLSMASAGGMSYLSLPGGDHERAYERIVVDHGHTSVAHTVHVSLVVAGITCAVENEFNGQRDVVHMARITEARTNVQSLPSIVVKDERLVPVYQRLLAFIDHERLCAESVVQDVERRSALEMLNLMYPSAKATAVVVSGTLRNFQKLLAAEFDDGKEDEYREALRALRRPLARVWPELFDKGQP